MPVHWRLTRCLHRLLLLAAILLVTTASSSGSFAEQCKTVLVGHEYPPQKHLHGADTRLLQLLSTLAQQCEQVFFVSYADLLPPECQEPWERKRGAEDVRSAGLNVVDARQYAGGSAQQMLQRIMEDLQPQHVMTTFWFWTFPLRPLWALQMLRAHQQSLAKSSYRAQFIVLSDDFHAMRERNLLNAADLSLIPPSSQQLRARIEHINPHYASMLLPDEYKLWLLQPSASRLRAVDAIEEAVYKSADSVVTVTKEDGQRLAAAFDLPNVELVPLQLRVDTSRSGITDPSELQVKQRRHVCFVGNGRNPTNAVGVAWLLKRVWPLVLANTGRYRRGAASPRLRLIGEEPSGGWQGLNQHVEVKGFVADALDATRECRLMVNPVQEASGFNTKNMVALENLIPLVTTSAGAAGLRLSDVVVTDEDQGIYVYDSPELVAETIVQILEKDVQWHWMRQAQVQFVQRLEEDDAHVRGVESILARQVDGCPPGAAEAQLRLPRQPDALMKSKSWEEMAASPQQLLDALLFAQSAPTNGSSVCIRTGYH